MLKRYFVTGLLLWVPLVITVWVLNLIVGTMDKSLALLPAQWQPQVWLGRDIPGVGVVLTVLIVFVTGLLTTNFIGRALIIDVDYHIWRLGCRTDSLSHH